MKMLAENRTIEELDLVSRSEGAREELVQSTDTSGVVSLTKSTSRL